MKSESSLDLMVKVADSTKGRVNKSIEQKSVCLKIRDEVAMFFQIGTICLVTCVLKRNLDSAGLDAEGCRMREEKNEKMYRSEICLFEDLRKGHYTVAMQIQVSVG